MPPDPHDPQLKLRDRQLKELLQAVETRLHSFMARIQSTKDAILPGPTKVWINHEIASYIKETRNKVKELRVRYGTFPCRSSLDPRMATMYTRDRESNPIGIDGAIAKLTQKLSKGDHVTVSIVGMGAWARPPLLKQSTTR